MPELDGELVERGGLVAPGAERGQRRRQHSLPGRHLPNGRGCLLEQGGDRRRPRREAHLHHRHHRLPRHRPARTAAPRRARLRARAARPARQALDRRAARRPRDLQERRLRPAARRARQGRLRRDDRPPGLRRRRRRRHRRPRPRRRRPGRAGELRHRHPLRRHGVVRLARSTARSRSTCSAPPASPPTLQDLGVTPHLVAVSTCYVAGNRRGSAPEIWSPTSPFSSTSTGAARSTAPAGPAATPRPRAARPSSSPSSAPRPATSSAPPARPRWPRRPSSCAPRWVSDRLVEAGQRPGRVARLARRLRLHQGARRAGAARDPRRRARSPSCARRSSSRRWPSPARAGSAASAWPSR